MIIVSFIGNGCHGHQKNGEECSICKQNTTLALPLAGYFQPFQLQAYLGQSYHDFIEGPSKSWGFNSSDSEPPK